MRNPMLLKLVHNPNLLEDTIESLGLHIDVDSLRNHLAEIKNRRPTHFEKLATLIDRIEFIDHLSLEFNIEEKEVVGLDHDIAALRLYLALTCVDIFSDFQAFNRWLLRHCNDRQDGEIFEDFLERKSQEYEVNVSTGANFRASFIQAPKELVQVLEHNLTVVTRSGSQNDIQTIASYLYRIRNKYTHEGRRFHHISSSPLPQLQLIGPRDEEALVTSPNFDFIGAILEVAKAKARQELSL